MSGHEEFAASLRARRRAQGRPGDDLASFVRRHLRVAPVAHVPELRLYQTTTAIGLWELTEGEYHSEQPPPFWAFAWAGGTGLARYLLDHPAQVAGRPVLDLASGSGLAAIAALRAGAAKAWAVEIDPLAAAAIELNAECNDVRVTVLLDDVLDRRLADLELPTDSLVIAGDVFYSQAMSARVLSFLRRAARDGAEVLVGDPGRAYLPRGHVTPIATIDVPVTRELESTDAMTVTIYRLSTAGGHSPASTDQTSLSTRRPPTT